MFSLLARKRFVAKVTIMACTMLLMASCTWMKPVSYSTPPHFSSWDLTTSQRDTLNAFFSEFDRLKKNNAILEKRYESNMIEIAKARAEKETLKKYSDYLTEELRETRSDLDYVEKQFVSFEKDIQSVETKASAVAAQAEAKIYLDKLQREHPDALDSLALSTVKSKLVRSDNCLRNEQYAAATYYARRAIKLIEISTRRHNFPIAEGDTKIIATYRANLRKGPGKQFKVIKKLDFGTMVIELTRDGSWSRVATEDGYEGWIYALLIK